MDDGLFLFEPGQEGVRLAAKQAGQAIRAAAFEAGRSVRSFLANAQSREELIQRLRVNFVEEAIEAAVTKHAHTVSDAHEKVVRAIVREWQASHQKAAASFNHKGDDYFTGHSNGTSCEACGEPIEKGFQAYVTEYREGGKQKEIHPGCGYFLLPKSSAKQAYSLSCPKCGSAVALASKTCPNCGHAPSKSDQGWREKSAASDDDDRPGPGKFEGNPSRSLSEDLHEKTLDQSWLDDEKGSSSEGSGWHGLLTNHPNGKHYVVHEDNQGFFSYDEHDTPEEARKNFESIPDDEYEDDDDRFGAQGSGTPFGDRKEAAGPACPNCGNTKGVQISRSAPTMFPDGELRCPSCSHRWTLKGGPVPERVTYEELQKSKRASRLAHGWQDVKLEDLKPGDRADVEWKARDIGYGEEEDADHYVYRGGPDWSGKHQFDPANAGSQTVYLFPDEIQGIMKHPHPEHLEKGQLPPVRGSGTPFGDRTSALHRHHHELYELRDNPPLDHDHPEEAPIHDHPGYKDSQDVPCPHCGYSGRTEAGACPNCGNLWGKQAAGGPMDHPKRQPLTCACGHNDDAHQDPDHMGCSKCDCTEWRPWGKQAAGGPAGLPNPEDRYPAGHPNSIPGPDGPDSCPHCGSTKTYNVPGQKNEIGCHRCGRSHRASRTAAQGASFEDAKGFAESRAKGLGHSLGAWDQQSSGDTGAACTNCGEKVFVHPRPIEGGTSHSYMGGAVAGPCRPRKAKAAGMDDDEGEYEEPDLEDAYTISPSGQLGQRTSVGAPNGKFLGEFEGDDQDDQAHKAIFEHMDKEQYWPSVYHISDHGNVDECNHWDDYKHAARRVAYDEVAEKEGLGMCSAAGCDQKAVGRHSSGWPACDRHGGKKTSAVEPYQLECYRCGKTGDNSTFGLGNDRKCPDCGSYSVHSPDAGKNWKKKRSASDDEPEVANPHDEDTTSNTYRVHMHEFDLPGLHVHADNEQDALDEAIDWHEQKGNKGLFLDQDELGRMDPSERQTAEDYGEISYGGNHGLPYDGSKVTITQVPRRK